MHILSQKNTLEGYPFYRYLQGERHLSNIVIYQVTLIALHWNTPELRLNDHIYSVPDIAAINLAILSAYISLNDVSCILFVGVQLILWYAFLPLKCLWPKGTNHKIKNRVGRWDRNELQQMILADQNVFLIRSHNATLPECIG